MTKRKWILSMMIVSMLAVGGCDLLQSSELTQDQIVALTNYADSLNAKLKVYQNLANELAGVLEVGGVLDVNDISKLAKINEEIDRITPQITAVSAAIRQGQYSSDDPDIINLLKVLSVANQSSAGFNPYAEIIAGVLFVVTTLLGWYSNKKKKEAAEAVEDAELAESTLTNVITGVEKSSAAASTEVKSNITNTNAEKALVTYLKPVIVKAV